MTTQDKHDVAAPEAVAEEPKAESVEKRGIDRFAAGVFGATLITVALAGSVKAAKGSGFI